MIAGLVVFCSLLLLGLRVVVDFVCLVCLLGCLYDRVLCVA